MKKIFLFYFSFFSILSFSQEKIAQDIFVNIINSIGNNFNPPPSLEIVQSENNPAYYSPNKNKIFIEEKVLKKF